MLLLGSTASAELVEGANNEVVAAYGLSRLFSTYGGGPVVELRRTSDSATAKFYPDATNSALVTNSGTPLAVWAEGGGVSVSTW